VQDPQVSNQARQAAARLEHALSATVDAIGHEVAGWFRRPDDATVATRRAIDEGDDAEAALEAGGEPVDDDQVEGPNSA
jgi:hypothetical protein